jgi:N utilization substance protein A
MRELNGEKLDVVSWSEDTAAFIANALSPAQVVSVELDEEDGIATVVVPDKQLSLAIGKEGQNARLAAKLSGWRIDIKSASIAEEEKLVKAVEPEEKAAPAAEPEEVAVPEEVIVPEEEAAPEPEPEPVLETELAPPETILKPPVEVGAETTSKLRFAEDVMGPAPTKATSKSRKKKKKGAAERSADDGARGRRRREREVFDEEDEY